MPSQGISKLAGTCVSLILKSRELWAGAGMASREGRGYPGSSHTSQGHSLALVYNAVRYINQ